MLSGVVFITVGESYTRDAVAAGRSVRESNPALQIDLFCDAPERVEDGVFDRVHKIEKPHRRSKVDYLPMSRFDRTLYLDSDVRVVADLTDMFALLERFDFAAAHAHARNRSQTNAQWRQHVPDAFPQLNGGVLLYRNCAEVTDLLQNWARAYSEAGFAKDQVTLRELIWLSDLRLFILPPEFNVRYPKYLKIWSKDEAKAKILHFKEFNSQESPNGLKQRLRAIFGKLRG
ncbi:hypothetical protein [Citreimonas sp.]|uniref:hypothetical protein n=1 Tax=Citreimonas sp. TaxID=3036715 RepID=UPI004057F1F3